MGDTNQRPQQDLFRNLVSDSKLVFLCRAIEQYDQAQVHLHQNEDHQRRVRQFMEYNRMKLIELDLARQRILQSSISVSSGRMSLNRGIGSPNIHIPKRATENSQEGVMKPRVSAKHSLPLQRPTELTNQTLVEIKRKTYKQRMASLAKHSDSIKPKSIHDNLSHQYNERYALNTGDSFSGDDDDDDKSSDEVFSERSPKDQKLKVPCWRNSSCFKDADVLFERGNFTYNHPGNKVYREYVKSLQDEYIRCRKNDKVSVATKVLNFIKNTCGGRFMACDKEGSGEWEELSDEAARRKIGQSLREKNKRYMPPARSRKNSKRIPT